MSSLSGIFIACAPSRHGLLSDLALTGAVCCASQRPAKSIYFDSRRRGRQTWHCEIKVPATVAVYRGHHRTLFFLPGIISLFIRCIGIIRNSSLVGGRAQAESNSSHWAHHALLHMAAKSVNHSATRAGYTRLNILTIPYTNLIYVIKINVGTLLISTRSSFFSVRHLHRLFL